MFRRILGFALAACMMFDSVSMTAFAATTQTEVIADYNAEETVSGDTTVAEEIVSENVIGEETVPEETGTVEETVDEEETVPETEDVSSGDVTEEEEVTSEEEITSEAVVTETVIEEVTENVTEEEVTEEVIVGDMEVAEEEDYPALSATAPTTVTIPTDAEGDIYYSFTAPESGFYNFTSDLLTSSTEDNIYAYMNLYTSEWDNITGDYANSSNERFNVLTDYMQAGETVYISFYSDSDYASTVVMNVEKVASYNLVKQEDGSYSATTDDFTFTADMEAGYQVIRGEISMTAKEDVTLARYYDVDVRARNTDTKSINRTESSLANYYDYIKTVEVSASQGSEYNVYFVISDDSTGALIAVIAGDLLLTTKTTNDSYVILNTATTETSITFDMESLHYGTIYYAPTDGSDEEKSMYLNSTWEEYEFNYLKPGTEYYFEFVDGNGNVLGREIVSTKATEAVVNMNAVLSEDGSALTVNAEVSNYNGEATSATLYCTYVDALDLEQSKILYLNSNGNQGEGSKTFSGNTTVDVAMLAGTEYEITLRVEIDGAEYAKSVKTITIPAAIVQASDITFSVASSETAGNADYTVNAEGLNGKGYIYYKPADDSANNYRFASFTTSEGVNEYTGILSGHQAGLEYKYILIVNGVMKETTATIGTATTKLTAVGDAQINAFDFVRTFKVESTEELTGNYYLRLYYMTEENTEWIQLVSYQTLNADNEYQLEVKTASSGKLIPNTEYKLKWTLATSSYGNPMYTVYETIKTKELPITLSDAKSLVNGQNYTVTLDKDSIANFSNFYEYLYAYVSKQDEDTYRQCGYLDLYSYNDYCDTLTITGLESGTNYKMSLRNSNGVEYMTTTFTTATDTRTLTVTSVEPSMSYVYLYYTMTNMNVVDYSYVHLYIREKGTEDAWENCDYNYFDNSATRSSQFYIGSYNNAQLKEDTTYEYKIGFGDDYDSSMDSLVKVVEGEFKTAKDTRTVTADVAAGYASADVQITWSANSGSTYAYIHCFYKKSNEEAWTKAGYKGVYNANETFSMSISGLTSGVTYDYAVVVADRYTFNTPDDVTKANLKATGQFTTKVNEYDLEFSYNEEKSTFDKAVVSVKATGSQNDSNVNVVLTLSNANGTVDEQKVTLKRSNEYVKDVTFTGLSGSTVYTISKAEFSVVEDGSVVEIGEKAYEYTFTTKEAVAPTEIVLQQEEIHLNLSGDYQEEIQATVNPATASDELVYSVSDNDVASVYSWGLVSARGVGETVVTVASAHNDAVKDTCKVTVKDYRVGYTDENGVVQFVGYGDYYYRYKTESIEGLGYYEVDAEGNATLLTDYKVTPVKSNVVVWSNGKLTAIGVGETVVEFEKDGYTTRFNVYSYSRPVGYGIVGISSSNSNYPAVKNEDGSYTLVHLSGVTYTAEGELSPYEYFNPTEFNWSVSGNDVVTVDSNGQITPVAPGKVTLTVTPKNNEVTQYIQDEVKVELVVKGLPATGATAAVYALANVDSKIGDVELPETWAGWSWKYPDTPLVTNGVNTSSYNFIAVNNGDDTYYKEATIPVYIGKITGVYAYEYGEHAGVVEVGGTDSIELAVNIIKQGTVSSSSYTIEIPEVEGLTITKNNAGYYDITASAAGKYTITPVVKAGDTVLATGKYVINAVTEKQVASIKLTTDTQGVEISGNKIIFETVDAKKDFNLNAVVKDSAGDEIATKLAWKTSDKSVATVAADKTDSHVAKVTAKGEGHAVITVTAQDKRGFQLQLDVEIQNHQPRISTNKATVNMAYDYSSYQGKSLASSAGLVEVVPVYGEWINNIQVLDKESKTVSQDFGLINYILDNTSYYMVIPAKDDVKTGKHNCLISVTTSAGNTYEYPLTVTVKNDKPAVTAKMSSKLNLFYTGTSTTFNLKVTKGARVDSVIWEDAAEGVNNGFNVGISYSYDNRLYVSQQENLAVVNGKLQDEAVATGTLTVKLYGYKDTYTINNFAIKYQYKKPSIVSKSSSTNVAPSMGNIYNWFRLYDKTNKHTLYYDESADAYYDYDEITCDLDDVELDPYSYYVNYAYYGTKNNSKITLTLDSAMWRESLTATHTIKIKNPKVYIENSTLTFRNNESGSDSLYTYLYTGEGYGVEFTDIAIKGANAKAQALMDNDLLMLVSWDNQVGVMQSDAAIMGKSIATGSYKYKLTPYYTDVNTGDKKALNTVNLTINVINKDITMKVTPKGSIDLANGSNYYVYGKTNCVWVDPKFANMTTNESIVSYKLVGEYSDYFYLGYYSGHRYIRANSSYLGKLKAGQAYKLAIECTVRNENGDTYTVTSNTFTIKPKQSKVKVYVYNNNQTLYAGADDTSRTYYLSTSDYYDIVSAYGGYDCNKDGVSDIQVSGGGSSVTVRINDRDAVVATAKGKTYTIPVTVMVEGRDGVTKDTTVNIKVKVKR